jgi:hypothetical protein
VLWAASRSQNAASAATRSNVKQAALGAPVLPLV